MRNFRSIIIKSVLLLFFVLVQFNSILARTDVNTTVVCLGEAFGHDWDEEAKLLIGDILDDSDKQIKFISAPTSRAEFVFQNEA